MNGQNVPKLEHCTACGTETGNAGRGDGSLYALDDTGPYCSSCFRSVERKICEAKLTRIFKELDYTITMSLHHASDNVLAVRANLLYSETDPLGIELYGLLDLILSVIPADVLKSTIHNLPGIITLTLTGTLAELAVSPLYKALKSIERGEDLML